MRSRPLAPSRRTTALVAGVLAVSLLAAGCGGTKEGAKKGGEKLADKELDAAAGESGLAKAGEPKRGGKLVYGLEADTGGGFCLSEGQLAISGMMVVRAVYDTLTVPNSKGDYVPYLAKAITHNDDYTEWNIELRDGVKFHDGSPLTAQVVKNNLDAYRGVYPGRSSLLFLFVLANIDKVDAVDDLDVKVTTKKPWVAFPSYLYSSSRLGIMAQAQLDSKDDCATKPIGTGPFVFQSWTPNQKFDAKRNPDYWQIAPDGKPYPYADSIEFRPIVDGTVRDNALESGDVNIAHTSDAKDIGTKLLDLRDAGKLNMMVSEAEGEVTFTQLNHTKAPFDDLRMRQALAKAVDNDALNQVMNNGLPTVAIGPFAPDSVAYVKDTGFPTYDLAGAKELVAAYEKDGKKAEFTLEGTTDASTKRLAELIQQRAEAAGMTVKIVLRDQAALINDAIGKKYQAALFRNFPGGDPDSNYVWWYSGTTTDGKFSPNLVNFAGFRDDEVDKLLDEGRSEPDPAKRKAIYQDLNKRMATQVHGAWSWYTPWAVVEGADVHGILGPPLPGPDASKPTADDDADLQPSRGLATGHSLLGLWVAR
ncbi:ABC transporter substrate-binding protein [Aquihabitans sp. G128]|uniref:ABC transporter substrate-binding protein n=1 Tax=Aquihabitans sp. G128 TaxID=2849779 RepID=UPI001C221577|nr:ABC transporter substrate-binding protein [Aquihabitans sp. G128]QXC61647.1 ABC transporter substrate-binding protein [Aquihabitans sp. G128]